MLAADRCSAENRNNATVRDRRYKVLEKVVDDLANHHHRTGRAVESSV
jgi:hypothetical protein